MLADAEADSGSGGSTERATCDRILIVYRGRIVADLAPDHDLDVLLGVWVSREAKDNAKEIEAGLRAAQAHPERIRAIVVGNETLLRRELTAAQLIDEIKKVRARTRLPLTYADVWEFWLENPEVAEHVDFVTVHILPYWEDYPVSIDASLAHVQAVLDKVKAAFRQADPHRRDRLAERGPQPRDRRARPRQPGAVRPRVRPARAAQRRPLQPDRGPEPALEARARGHRRRLLGTARRGPRGEVAAGHRSIPPRATAAHAGCSSPSGRSASSSAGCGTSALALRSRPLMLERDPDRSEPRSLEILVREFLDYLRLNRSASEHTVRAYDGDLSQFVAFLAGSRGVKRATLRGSDVTTMAMRDFLAELHRRGNSRASAARRVSVLRTFARYLRREHAIEDDPAALVGTPRLD